MGKACTVGLATIALHLTTTTICASTWGCVCSLFFVMRLYQTDSFVVRGYGERGQMISRQNSRWYRGVFVQLRHGRPKCDFYPRWMCPIPVSQPLVLPLSSHFRTRCIKESSKKTIPDNRIGALLPNILQPSSSLPILFDVVLHRVILQANVKRISIDGCLE
jgi:hypothetical protein